MGFGDFLRGIIAQVNPFDGGKTYGTYNPPKKRDDFGNPIQPSNAPKTPNSNSLQVSQPPPQSSISIQRPDNLFAGLQNNLRLPGSPQNTVPVTSTQSSIPPANPTPGTIIQPNTANPQSSTTQNPTITVPHPSLQPITPPSSVAQPKPGFTPNTSPGSRGMQDGWAGTYGQNGTFQRDAPTPQRSIWDKIAHPFALAGQTAVGSVENLPEVGLAAARAGTGIVQGVGQLPHIVTAGVATGTQALADNFNNSVTRQINRGAQDANTGIKTATHYAIDDALDPINRNLDAAAKGYQNLAPGDAGGANAYRYTQIPINALAAVLTRGASAGAEGAAGAGEAGANAGRIASIVNKFHDLLNTPLTSNTDNIVSRTANAISNKVSPVVNAVNAPISTARNGVSRVLGRNAPAVNDVVDAGEGANVINGAEDLAKPPTQIQVQQPQSIPVNSPVDEGTNVPVTNNTPVGNPIREVGGDTPGQVKMPTPEEVAAQRAKTNYDTQAPGRPDRSVDGISRPNTGNTGVFTRAEIQKEQQALDDALANKEINKTAHKAASAELANTKAIDDVPTGQKIQVKSVEGIPVEDKTVVPQGLPEKPGTVRATEQAAPALAKSEAVAARQAATPITDVRELSKKAKNSLENDTTGIKPNGVERSGGRVENGTAKPVEYRQLPDGSVTIVDGRHTLEYARQNGIHDFPTKDVTSQYPETPTTATPAQLPIPKVGSTLPDGTKVTQRMVDSARNQRKLSNQLAKQKEGTAANVARMDSASPIPTSGEGLVPTGKFDTSANGGAYETASRQAEMNQARSESSQMAPTDAISTARANQSATGGFNPRDIRNIRAMFESKRIPRGTPEWDEARQILKEDGTLHAQSLALRGGTIFRRTASPTELMSQYESKLYRLANDPSKIDSKALDAVDAATTKFTDARDAATAANNRFTESPTTANAKAYHAAQDAADQADKEAKMMEYKVAKTVLKGNKDAKQARMVQQMAHDSGMGQMDAIDASMLSGTGTFARNFINSAIGGAEEGAFGGVGSRIAKALTGENVGGGAGRGTLSGFGKGVKNLVNASKASASEAGWNPLAHAKNWATTGNELGDPIMDSQVAHNVLDHYTQDLKAQGYTGRELTDRAGVMARQDPQNLTHTYAGYAKAAAGLGSGVAKGSAIESVVKNWLSDAMSMGNPNKVSETAAKLITRMTVGFPSAVGRTVSEGLKRTPVVGQLYDAAKIISAKDSAARALAIKESIKHAGTAATTSGIFYHLGQSGAITGAYPSDPTEREKWTREGITENSIKIDGNYYQLPSYLGSAALPAIFAATLGRNNGDVAKSTKEVLKAIPSILPTSTADNLMNVINQKTNAEKYAISTAASATRALTPAGALLNQIAKSFDTTTNDTTTGNALNQFVDKVMTGIPGQNKMINIPDKTDAQGNVLHNPSALPLALGASSTTQDKGVATTNAINDKANADIKSLNDIGALKDPNILAVIANDDKAQKIYTALQGGKQLTPAEVKTLRAAVTKGVPTNGDDTAYLEKGQYDSNLAALNAKRAELAADPTTKPSVLKTIDLNIKRGQVYKDNNMSYDDITAYKNTSVADWRKMGDDTSDTYDPAMYQKLWNTDQLLTKAGASYDPKDPTGAKFSVKPPAKGGSKAGAVGGGWNAGFGQIKGIGAPTVQQYQTISQSPGQIPTIQRTHPNVVHAISWH